MHDPQARHGPYFSLTRAEGGKTRSRYLSAEQAALASQQVEAGQEFRKQVETYWQACEQWGDSQLEASEAASQEASQKGGFKTAFAVEIVAEIEALLGTGVADAWDFEAIETAARCRALAVAARAIAQRLNADHCDHVGPTLACVACHKPARYAGRRKKSFETALGEMTLGRAYYHCDSCEAGFCPRDRALGLLDTTLSPACSDGWAGGRHGQLRGGARVGARAGRGGRADQARRARGRGAGA